jgi:hypothetical protein
MLNCLRFKDNIVYQWINRQNLFTKIFVFPWNSFGYRLFYIFLQVEYAFHYVFRLECKPFMSCTNCMSFFWRLELTLPKEIRWNKGRRCVYSIEVTQKQDVPNIILEYFTETLLTCSPQTIFRKDLSLQKRITNEIYKYMLT